MYSLGRLSKYEEIFIPQVCGLYATMHRTMTEILDVRQSLVSGENDFVWFLLLSFFRVKKCFYISSSICVNYVKSLMESINRSNKILLESSTFLQDFFLKVSLAQHKVHIESLTNRYFHEKCSKNPDSLVVTFTFTTHHTPHFVANPPHYVCNPLVSCKICVGSCISEAG